MVIRSLIVLGSAILVGLSPAWLTALGGWLRLSNDAARALPFSPYLVTIPAALAIALSWVYEMGGAAATDFGRVFNAGNLTPVKRVTESSERRGDAKERKGSRGAASSKTSVWRRLEVDFREILEFGADLDATWERTSTYADAKETWRLSGVYEEQRILKKFNELAETAGRMLVEWPGYTPPLSPATMSRSFARDRWLCALRDREIKTEVWAPGQVLENDRVTGHVHGGAIRDVIEASIEFCVQLMLEESLEDRTSAAGESLGARLILPEKAS